jgi:hypothetical protein
MQSNANKSSKYSVIERQVIAQMGAKLIPFLVKERSEISQRYKNQTNPLDSPRIWLGFVLTVSNGSRSIRLLSFDLRVEMRPSHDQCNKHLSALHK